MPEEKEVVKKVSRVLTEADFQQERLDTAAILAKQPKKRVKLPKLADPKAPNYETVQINGYTFQIQRGPEVEVPEEVWNILDRAGII